MVQEVIDLGATQHAQQPSVVHDRDLWNAFPVHGFKNVDDTLMRRHPAKSGEWGHESFYSGLIPKVSRDRRDLLPSEDTFKTCPIQHEKPSWVRGRIHTIFKSGQACPGLNARTIRNHQVGSGEACE